MWCTRHSEHRPAAARRKHPGISPPLERPTLSLPCPGRAARHRSHRAGRSLWQSVVSGALDPIKTLSHFDQPVQSSSHNNTAISRRGEKAWPAPWEKVSGACGPRLRRRARSPGGSTRGLPRPSPPSRRTPPWSRSATCAPAQRVAQCSPLMPAQCGRAPRLLLPFLGGLWARGTASGHGIDTNKGISVC